MATNQPAPFKRRRGFAAMSPDLQREIASKGGKAAHDQGTAHEWTREEAKAAGRLGGRRSKRPPNQVAEDWPVAASGRPTDKPAA